MSWSLPKEPFYQWRTGYGSDEGVRRLASWKLRHRVEHCWSCHGDDEHGYDMCEIDTPRGVVSCCCTVAAALRQASDAS
jgi:hypothetical protein